MAFKLPNRVHETSTTGGTGALALAGALAGRKPFAARLAVNDTSFVTAHQPSSNKWVTGFITFTQPGGVDTVTFTTIFESSEDADAAPDFTAGQTIEVFIDLPAFTALPADMRALLASSVDLVSFSPQNLTGTQQDQARKNVSAALRGHLFGLTLSNNGVDATNDIDIAGGEAASTEASPALMTLAASLTKRLDALWAVGSGNGGLDTGSIANATYHVWLIQRSDTGVVDALFSTSATTPAMPENYDRKRRIGSLTRAGAAIRAFTQNGDVFLLTSPVAINTVTVNGTAVDLALAVPTGITIEALVDVYGINSGGAAVWNIFSPFVSGGISLAQTNFVSPSSAVGNSAMFRILTNNANMKAISNQSSGGTVNYATLGWVDSRGR